MSLDRPGVLAAIRLGPDARVVTARVESGLKVVECEVHA